MSAATAPSTASLWLKLLTPSWLSLLVGTMLAGLLSAGVVLVASFKAGVIYKQIVSWQQSQPTAALVNSPPSINHSLLNSWPLLIFWALVGLLVYFGLSGGARFIVRTDATYKSLKFVHANPKSIIETSLERALMRLVALIGLIILAVEFFHRMVPFAAAESLNGSPVGSRPLRIVYLLLAFFVIFLYMHLIGVFLRLAVGKVRVFK